MVLVVTLARRFLPAFGGFAAGGGFGLVWWLTWGCRFCGPDAPYGPILFSALAGAVVSHVLFRDHLQPR